MGSAVKKKKKFPSSSVTKRSYFKARAFSLEFDWFIRHFKSVVIAHCIFCRSVSVRVQPSILADNALVCLWII